ncbi:MAG: hypothetical protein R2746_06585 [Acidimicrobiales bacterium]
MTPRPARRTALAALGVALLVGCSSDDTAVPATTTSAPPTTIPTDPPGPGPTPAELVGVLPAAADLGPDWVEALPEADEPDPASGAEDPTDRAIADQCPELADLMGAEPDDPDDDHVTRRYVDGDGRELSVELDPTPRMRTDADLEARVEATNRCDEVVVDDRDGVTTTLRFQAAVDPDHGEQAVKFQAVVEVSLPFEADPITLELYGLAFRTGTVGVSISASDGLDPESLGVNRTDVELLASVSDRLEAAVDDLVG